MTSKASVEGTVLHADWQPLSAELPNTGLKVAHILPLALGLVAAGCSEAAGSGDGEGLANTGAGLNTNSFGGFVAMALVALAGAAVVVRRRSNKA